MARLTKAQRKQVLSAVDCGWYCDISVFRAVTARWPGWLYQIAWDCLTVLDAEPWRNFGDVLNEVLDY